MPYSEKQRRFFYSELNRKKKGMRGRTKISIGKLKRLVESPLEKEMNR